MKILKSILAFCMALTLIYTENSLTKVHATNFEGKERDYISRCNKRDMSNSDIKVCKEFNQYLTKKNQDLKASISGKEKELDQAQSDLDALNTEIQNYDNQIALLQDQIAYFTSNIQTLENSIAERDEILSDRMYLMQDYVNVNYYIDFIIKASSLSDLFSRIECVLDISGADKDLLVKMKADKKELQQQKTNLEASQENLQALKADSASKRALVEAKADELSNDLDALYNLNTHSDAEINALDDAIQASVVNQAQIEAAKKAAEEAAKKAAEEAAKKAAEEARKKAEEEARKKAEEEKRKQEAANQTSSSPSTTPAQTQPQAPVTTPAPTVSGSASSAALGAMNFALTKQGYPYSWGGTGPGSYDCSGLMMRAYESVGINIGRTTYNQCVKGISVSWDHLLPGDLLFWTTLGGAQPSHVGMYIGNGLMIHAGTVSTGVVVVNINTSYWIGKRYCARRVA